MMNNKDLYHPYVNENGKYVSGSAALNHYIHTVKGGVQKYNDEIGGAYIKAFIEAHTDIINAELIAQLQRDKFKVV